MADYNQIKTLTIDGTTMGMVEGLGETISASKTITSFPTSWSWKEGASITLPAGEAYIVRFEASFPTASSTGVRQCAVGVRTGSGDSLFNKITNGDAQAVILFGMGFRGPRSSADTYTIIVASSKGVTGNQVQTNIYAQKIVGVPTT